MKNRAIRTDDQNFGNASVPKNWRRNVFERTPSLIYVTDIQGVFLDINEAGVRMLGGASRDEFAGALSILTFFAEPSDRIKFRELVARVGSIQEFETRFRRLDNDFIDVSITGTPRFNCRGEPSGYEGFIIDITAKKRTERTLKESVEAYFTIVENSLAAISIHQEGRNQFVNRRYAEMLGYDDPAECIGRPFWASVHPEDLAMVKERGLLRENQQILPAQYVFRQLKKDKKTVVWVHLRAVHALYMGKPAAVTNFIDITQSKMAEEEIRNLSSRLVKVREEERKMLAADLHDQMGQTLTAMHFEIESLQKELPSCFTVQKHLCDRLIGHVELLADKVRKTVFHLRRDVLDQMMLIAVLERQVHEFTGRHPEIHIDFQSLGFKKRLNPEIELIIYRIFQEGLTNIAKHARASQVEIMLTYSHPRVMLIIRDNGVGFDQKQKKSQTGRLAHGIGHLSMKERVTSFGGHIDIISTPGKGTMIRIDIPV